MATLRLRPHHLLDIMRDYGNDIVSDAHPYGAALAEVTKIVLSDIDQEIVLVPAVDSICQPCAKLHDGLCVARINDKLLMRTYNDRLDARLFERIALQEGQSITVRAFMAIVEDDLEGIVSLFDAPANNYAVRLRGTRKALENIQGGEKIKHIYCTPIVFTFPATEYDNVERWGIEQWTMAEMERLFAEMARDGVKLILPMTGAGDKVWYPSKILRNPSDCDWIDRLFALAAGHGMEVILSGVSYTYHLQFQG